MKNGFVLPFGDARMAADMASLAEQHGWDGFFVWEPVWGNDAWVMLTAAAMRTERIRLGTMLTPLSRMKPWKLASETATLDNLSGGRVTLAVGLGAPDTGWEAFGEITDRRTRAELLDEGLDVLTGLWKGQPYAYEGKHYHVKPTDFMVPAAAGTAAADPHLGGGRVAVSEVDGTCPALRRADPFHVWRQTGRRCRRRRRPCARCWRTSMQTAPPRTRDSRSTSSSKA